MIRLEGFICVSAKSKNPYVCAFSARIFLSPLQGPFGECLRSHQRECSQLPPPACHGPPCLPGLPRCSKCFHSWLVAYFFGVFHHMLGFICNRFNLFDWVVCQSCFFSSALDFSMCKIVAVWKMYMYAHVCHITFAQWNIGQSHWTLLHHHWRAHKHFLNLKPESQQSRPSSNG